MNELVVANVQIRRDSEGRYCLNDLHRAAGEDARNKPGNWLMLDQTKDLIAEVEIAGNPAIHSKQGLGTFVAKELVYAYAMWISAVFHLRVIRAYDAVVTGQSGIAVPQTLPEALRLAADLADKNEKQRLQLVAAQPKVEFVDKFVNADGVYGLCNAARALGLPPRKFTKFLQSHGYLFHEGGQLVPYAKHRPKEIFEVKSAVIDDKARYQTYVTPRGLKYFADRVVERQGRLDLKPDAAAA